MIRVGSQLVFCSPGSVYRRMVVELNELNIIEGIFSLDEGNVETANTLFYDGILSSGIVSLKQNVPAEKVPNLINGYQYFDISDTHFSLDIKLTDKPLILDFGTARTDKINALLPCLSQLLPYLSVFEIIAASTFYPSLLAGQTPGLKEKQYTDLILWENVNLTEKKLTSNTRIREINR